MSALATRCATPLVATGDVLYHTPHRRPLQDVLSCVREKTTIQEAGLKLEANAERHLKWPLEMGRLFRGHEDALARTLEIADACKFSLEELVYEYPDEPTPPGKTPQAHLEELAWEGAHWRFPDGIPDKVRSLITRELQLIDKLDTRRTSSPCTTSCASPARRASSARGAARPPTPSSATASPSRR